MAIMNNTHHAALDAVMAAAGDAGLDLDWSLELARNYCSCVADGFEDPFETAVELLSWRVAKPGAGRPAAFHGAIAQLTESDIRRIAGAIAKAWSPFAEAEVA